MPKGRTRIKVEKCLEKNQGIAGHKNRPSRMMGGPKDAEQNKD